MFDADSFSNIIEVVRCCVRAGRADLIEPALIDRLHVGEVAARIEAERTAAGRPAAAPRSEVAPAARGGVTADDLERAAQARFRAQNPPDPLADAIRKRFVAAKGGA